jgi:hypothetical protein
MKNNHGFHSTPHNLWVGYRYSVWWHGYSVGKLDPWVTPSKHYRVNKHMNLCHISNVSVRIRLTVLPANGPVPQLKMQLNDSTFKLIAILDRFDKVPMHVIHRDQEHIVHRYNLL